MSRSLPQGRGAAGRKVRGEEEKRRGDVVGPVFWLRRTAITDHHELDGLKPGINYSHSSGG